MKNKIYPLLWLISLPFLMSACVVASDVVHTNAIKAPGAKPASYSTYAWYQEPPKAAPSYDKGYGSDLHQYLRRAIEAELQQMGYTKTGSNPDVLLAYDVSVSVPVEKDKPENFAPGFGYSYAYMSGYRYDYSDAGLPSYRSVDLFKQGTLIIDMVHPRTKELVWRGWSEGAVSKFNEKYKQVQQQVSEVLSKLPQR